MKRSITVLAAGVAAAVVLAGCATSKDMVDGKAQVEVPMPSPTPPATCYLLEVEHESPQGNQVGENYFCVPKAEWDQNREGEEWVDANGKRK